MPMTTGTKYSRYILTEQGASRSTPDAAVKPVVLQGASDWCGIRHRLKWKFLLKPGVVMDTPHTHDFDEFLVFLSANPADELDFPAEIELLLGAEGEPNIISEPSVICLPQGLIHGPLTVKDLGKPVLFCIIYLSPDYHRRPAGR